MEVCGYRFSVRLVVFGLSLLAAARVSALPSIDLGADRVVCATAATPDGRYAIRLAPILSDDLPVSWDGAGPGEVSVVMDAGSGTTLVQFATSGSYRLTAEIEDPSGSAADEMLIHVSPGPDVHWKLDD